MSLAIGLGALAASTAALLYTWRVAVRYTSTWEVVRREIDGALGRWKNEVEQHLELLDSELEMGVKRVKRTEDRIRAVVRSALKKLDDAGIEDPALEAEAEEIQLGDGEGSSVFPMHPMPEGMVVDQPDDRPSGIPGLTENEVQALKARRQAG